MKNLFATVIAVLAHAILVTDAENASSTHAELVPLGAKTSVLWWWRIRKAAGTSATIPSRVVARDGDWVVEVGVGQERDQNGDCEGVGG